MITLLESAKRRSWAIPDDSSGTKTAGGLALSPYHAGLQCQDFDRITAIWSALEKCTNDDPDALILYAGCGPVAPLVLPALEKTNCRVHCVDIHAASLESAKWALAPWRDRCTFEQADLCNWQWDRPNQQPSIIVAETLNAGLLNEPQIAIWRNLFWQFPSAAWIPCGVAVKFTEGGVAIFSPSDNDPAPVDFVANENGITIETVVEMYPGDWLSNSNSPLTQPIQISTDETGPGVAEYFSNETPGWKLHFTGAAK